MTRRNIALYKKIVVTYTTFINITAVAICILSHLTVSIVGSCAAVTFLH